ncbi:MAG: PilN domain-containing protein [Rhodocyclaceae bacterium]|nr:PilN domain-containing protein [Rhodocyclaceae bacterium]
MIRINLLPHREQKRKDRRQQFYALVGLMALAGGLVGFAVHTFISSEIDRQNARNAFIERENAALDKQIAEIRRLREQIDALLARKQVIESLQTHRSGVVRLFNEIAVQMPEGVYLTTVQQTGDKVMLAGYAQSNARVSTLMRNLDGSPYLADPQLIETKAAIEGKRRVSQYQMSVSFERPKPENGEEAAK